MSTVANPGTAKVGSRFVPAFVTFMAVSAAMVLVQFATAPREWHRWEFLGLALAGAISSRLKVKLPGLNGNMSVNLPFIFIAMTRLGMGEALVVAGVSVFVQSIPKAPHKFVPVHALFNISTALVAAGLGWDTFHLGLAAHWNLEAALVLACASHFLASIVPVAVIISLVENRPAFRTWSDIFDLSFPYYLASTGLTSIMAGVGVHANWATLVGIACVMFVTYRCYRRYFTAMQNSQLAQPALAKAAAAAK